MSLKKHKKPLALLLAFAVCAAMCAAGCNDNTDDTESSIEESAFPVQESSEEEPEDQSLYSVTVGFDLEFTSKSIELTEEEYNEVRIVYDERLAESGYDQRKIIYDPLKNAIGISARKKISADDYIKKAVKVSLENDILALTGGMHLSICRGDSDSRGEEILSRFNISSARADYSRAGYIVVIEFDDAGKEIFSKATLKYLHQDISVWDGDNFLASATLYRVNTEGVLSLRGDYTEYSANRVASEIMGQLPFNLSETGRSYILPSEEELSKASENVPWCISSGDIKIPAGILNYYIYESVTEAMAEIQSYSTEEIGFYDIDFDSETLDDKPVKEWIAEKALRKTEDYLFYLLAAKEYGIEIGNELWEAEWKTSGYYSYEEVFSDLGISRKSYIMAQILPKKIREELLNKLYGEGGEYEITDSDLKKYYTENFVEYCCTYYYFTNMTEEESMTSQENKTNAEYRAIYEKYAEKVNSGELTIDEAIAQLKKEMVIANFRLYYYASRKNDIPDTFISQAILDTKEGGATVYTSDDDFIALIFRYDIQQKADELIKAADRDKKSEKESYLQFLKEEAFEKYMSDASKTLNYQKNTDVFERYTADRAVRILKSSDLFS